MPLVRLRYLICFRYRRPQVQRGVLPPSCVACTSFQSSRGASCRAAELETQLHAAGPVPSAKRNRLPHGRATPAEPVLPEGDDPMSFYLLKQHDHYAIVNDEARFIVGCAY